MKLEMNRVYLQLVYNAARNVQGARVSGWTAIEPEYNEDTPMVNATVECANEFVVGQVNYEYARLLQNRVALQA